MNGADRAQWLRQARARARFAARGTAFVETLVAIPIVLLLGLGALQWALLFHARTALEYALLEGARAGSVAQARPDAIESGLARGLMPFWFGVDANRPWAAAVAESNAQLRQAIAAGWIAWRQLAPTVESFGDWGEPARDAAGYPVASLVEIPNDSLQWASLRQPAGGAAGMHGDEPIGARSLQTLNDANLLKLELRYGVPMNVPLVGRLAVWLMRIVDGCAAPSGRQLGTVGLGVPAPIGAPRAWTCPFYLAPDATGNPVPRWPVRTAATIRMQSPARQSANTPNRRESPVFGGAAGPTVASSVGATPSVPPAPVASTRPPGPLVPTAPTVPAASGGPVAASANNDGSRSRADSGWLEIGAERTFSVPGACT